MLNPRPPPSEGVLWSFFLLLRAAASSQSWVRPWKRVAAEAARGGSVSLGCRARTVTRINSTENRSVLHVALRAPWDAVICSDGNYVVPDVWNVLDKVEEFTEKVRDGSWVGVTGKASKDVVPVWNWWKLFRPIIHELSSSNRGCRMCQRAAAQIGYVIQLLGYGIPELPVRLCGHTMVMKVM